MSAEIIAWLRSEEGIEWSLSQAPVPSVFWVGQTPVMRRDGPVNPAEILWQAADRPGGGRVSKRSGSKNRQRQKQVSVRLTDEEYALLLATAKHLGVSPPSVLRYAFLAEYHPSAAGVTRKPG